jgi:hypothetical protein
MIKRSQDLGFALEAGQTLGILRQGIREDLDGDVTIGLGIASAVHFAHTPADQRQNLV